MKHSFQRLAWLILAVWTTLAHAAQVQPTITISTPHSVIKAGEGLNVHIVFTNRSDKAITVERSVGAAHVNCIM